jgi:hypothetical protein
MHAFPGEHEFTALVMDSGPRRYLAPISLRGESNKACASVSVRLGARRISPTRRTSNVRASTTVKLLGSKLCAGWSVVESGGDARLFFGRPMAATTVGSVATSSDLKCARSQRAADRGGGSAFAHAVIKCLRLFVGWYAEKVLQQLAAAPVGLQRLAVISELLVAEHQASI